MTIAVRNADLDLQNPVLVRQLSELKVLQPTAKQPTEKDTSVHPAVIAIPVAATAWFVGVAWLAFGGGETNIILGVIAVFCVLYLGLFIGGGAKAYNAGIEPVRRRGFREFWNGEVDTATGRIPGHEAFWQIVTMPLAFAIGFTIIATIAAVV